MVRGFLSLMLVPLVVYLMVLISLSKIYCLCLMFLTTSYQFHNLPKIMIVPLYSLPLVFMSRQTSQGRSSTKVGSVMDFTHFIFLWFVQIACQLHYLLSVAFALLFSFGIIDWDTLLHKFSKRSRLLFLFAARLVSYCVHCLSTRKEFKVTIPVFYFYF